MKVETPKKLIMENYRDFVVVFFPASTPSMACRDEPPQRNSVCVLVEFGNSSGSSGAANIACTAVFHQENREVAPTWLSMTSLVAVNCDKSKTCRYIIQDSDNDRIQPGTKYDVFCVDWKSSFPFTVFPTCKGKSCGLQDAGGGRTHQVFGVEDFLCVLLLLAYIGWSYVPWTRTRKQVGYD
eukprot:symbB.v1.2.008574.t1/scaffold511.1/size325556/21